MKRVLLLLFLNITGYFLQAQNGVNFFNSLRNCDKKERIQNAISINYKTIVSLDSFQTIMALKELEHVAKEQKDAELQALETLFYGEFYYNRWDALCMSFFEKGLLQATMHHNAILKAQALHDIGLQLYRDAKYNLAFEHLLKANYIMKDYGYSHYPMIARYLTDFGIIYYQFNDFEKSVKLLQEATNYPLPNISCGIKLNNTLGLCNRELGNLPAAKENFIKTIELAKQAKDSAWVGIGSGNLGSIYYKLNQYSEAISLLNIDYRLSLQNKEYQSAFTTLCMLADIYVSSNQPDSARYFISKASELLSVVKDAANARSYYNAKAGFYKVRKDYTKAFIYLDSAEHYNKVLQKRDLANIKAKAEQKVAVEKYLSDVALVESKKEIAVLTRNAVILGLVLFLIIAALLLRNLLLKRKNDKQELAGATDQLKLYVESLKEKTNLISQFEVQLKNADLQSKNSEAIEQLQSFTILTEDHWNEFRRLFDKVHFNFFVKLKQKYPDLTQSEIRLMSLIKLNLGKKEMADMLGISPDSVKKTRQRVKKKIMLPENVDLEEIAFSI